MGGLASVLLTMVELAFAPFIGAFLGGIVAAYILYGKVGQASLAGAISGILSTPFSLGLSDILVIFELIPIPAGPAPTLEELQAAVVVVFGINFVAGAVGGSLLGLVRRPVAVPPPPPPPSPGQVPGQSRYCVQCGAQMPAGTLICPHCNARQPS